MFLSLKECFNVLIHKDHMMRLWNHFNLQNLISQRLQLRRKDWIVLIKSLPRHTIGTNSTYIFPHYFWFVHTRTFKYYCIRNYQKFYRLTNSALNRRNTTSECITQSQSLTMAMASRGSESMTIYWYPAKAEYCNIAYWAKLNWTIPNLKYSFPSHYHNQHTSTCLTVTITPLIVPK